MKKEVSFSHRSGIILAHRRQVGACFSYNTAWQLVAATVCVLSETEQQLQGQSGHRAQKIDQPCKWCVFPEEMLQESKQNKGLVRGKKKKKVSTL